MSKNEDTVPDSYPYYWSPESSTQDIKEFVTKYKPSMVQDDGTKPWLWVRNSNSGGGEGERKEAVEEASTLLVETTESVERIKNDDKIPTRSNKKTGAKSKKELREQVQSEAAQKLREIHTKHNYKAGKWLVFVPPDKVDSVWSRIAISVATGPLSETFAYMAKVATTPANESSSLRVICIYVPDVFDQPNVTKVMRILLRNHGVNLSGVKSNLYTEIGLDSKHPSGIQSTVWKNVALMKEAEMKELKDNFFAELKADQEKGGPEPKAQAAKSKVPEEDPFGDDDDEHANEEKSGHSSKQPLDDPFASDGDGNSNGDTATQSKYKVPKRKNKEVGDDGNGGGQNKATKAQRRR